MKSTIIAIEEYKGFEIKRVDSDGFSHFVSRYYIEGGQFNPEGYSTLNTAKGAITKHLKALESQESTFVQSVINTKTQPADEPKADATSVAVPVRSSQAEADHIMALLTYHGFKTNPSDKRSRNSREGTGHVKVNGRYVRSPNSDKLAPEPRTRKQRKAAAYSSFA